MSIYAAETYGISASGNGAGTPANGVAHPGDYAPAQKVLNFCEIIREEHSKTQLGSAMNNMLPPLTRRQTEPVDLNIYPEYEGDDFTAAMKSSRQSERLRIAKENESRLKERIDTMREHRERIASDLGSRMRNTAPNTLKKLRLSTSPPNSALRCWPWRRLDQRRKSHIPSRLRPRNGHFRRCRSHHSRGSCW